jgi:hypothetical protein
MISNVRKTMKTPALHSYTLQNALSYSKLTCSRHNDRGAARDERHVGAKEGAEVEQEREEDC